MSAVQPELLRVTGLSVSYRLHEAGRRAALLHAVRDVSFELAGGQTLGIVGESGSGKSSIARALLRLVPASSGQACFDGQDLLQLRGAPLQRMRRSLQLIFQDPLASLDPRMSAEETVSEPLRVFEPALSAAERSARARVMLEAVGLSERYLPRLPHELSGGQAQRIAIARALILRPRLLFCDEPLSSLDVSIKSQIGNLLMQLQAQLGLSMVFISHDLAAVRFACSRVLVLYLGRVMELADRDALFSAARHPYTRALLQSAPLPDPRLARRRPAGTLGGEIPSPLAPPSGCVFRTRCAHAIDRCAAQIPALRRVGGSLVACHRAEEIAPY
ncbi:MAG TPA: oligopeptide/dipeptide ABC transporter ATP-binding protein [Steroidobacteraceae bacterium]|nr:oligopeptide/dipeptide ABC transporter ATP-binding protein [Steroidobacteraceae bacterium]